MLYNYLIYYELGHLGAGLRPKRGGNISLTLARPIRHEDIDTVVQRISRQRNTTIDDIVIVNIMPLAITEEGNDGHR